jgi:hypothetical protein
LASRGAAKTDLIPACNRCPMVSRQSSRISVGAPGPVQIAPTAAQLLADITEKKWRRVCLRRVPDAFDRKSMKCSPTVRLLPRLFIRRKSTGRLSRWGGLRRWSRTSRTHSRWIKRAPRPDSPSAITQVAGSRSTMLLCRPSRLHRDSLPPHDTPYRELAGDCWLRFKSDRQRRS